MSISISNSQSGIFTTGSVSNTTKVSAQSTAEISASGTKESVSISGFAQALYTANQESAHQASLSKGELRNLYTKGQSDVYNFGQLIAGGGYQKESLLPKTDDLDRLELGRKALEFSISLSQVPQGKVANPFAGMDRKDLSAIVYDGSESFTSAERYAAYSELFRQDQIFAQKLAPLAQPDGDTRLFFKSILDYFDDLPPVEQAAYPDDFRDNIEKQLKKENEKSGLMALIEKSVEKASEAPLDPDSAKDQTPMETLQALVAKMQEASRTS